MATIGDFVNFDDLITQSKKIEEERKEAENLADDLAAFKAAMGE